MQSEQASHIHSLYKLNYLQWGASRQLHSTIGDILYVFIPEHMDDYRDTNYFESELHRTLNSDRIHPSFKNRPHNVICQLVKNSEYADKFEYDDIEIIDTTNNIFSISKSIKNKNVKYIVYWNDGRCECNTFTDVEIPCIHIFAVIKYTNLEFDDLPAALLNSKKMTLYLPNPDNTNNNDSFDIPPIPELPTIPELPPVVTMNVPIPAEPSAMSIVGNELRFIIDICLFKFEHFLFNFSPNTPRKIDCVLSP
eukprot:546677_1